MATLPYPCTANPLSASGLEAAMDALKIDAATLWAMVHVETGGCGYFSSRRPQILFERCVFSKLTGGKWDAVDPEVSSPQRDPHGAGGDHQYSRLARAYTINPEDPADLTVLTPTRMAALESASWGLGQVMGSNARIAGFNSVGEMVSAMAASEDQQLKAVVNFVLSKGLDKALQSRDWAAYAYHYNGSDYASNQYDTKLADAYALYQDSSKRPNLTIRAAQMLLFLLGYNPQGVDGSIGAHTLTALHAFQTAKQMSLSIGIDDGVVQSLAAALPAAPNLALA